MVKIIHIGYPVDHPERKLERVKRELAELVEAMTAKGLEYKLVLITEEELQVLKKEIINGQPDAIIMGGGLLRGNTVHLGNVLNIVHENAPKTTKLIPISMPPDVHAAVKINFNV